MGSQCGGHVTTGRPMGGRGWGRIEGDVCKYTVIDKLGFVWRESKNERDREGATLGRQVAT